MVMVLLLISQGSKKYYERLASSNGTSSKAVQSKFGIAMLKKMGWSEGKGLGRAENGIVECIQVQRREEGVGLGQEKKDKFRWNDSFWKDIYDSVASKLTVEVNQTSNMPDVELDSSSSSEEEESKKTMGRNEEQEITIIPSARRLISRKSKAIKKSSKDKKEKIKRTSTKQITLS